MQQTFAHLEDSELLIQYRKGSDARCVGELYRRYSHLVFGVCMKYLKNSTESEDAVMEIFEKLHLDLRKVEVEHFKSWLYTVARNHCLMKMRKAGLNVSYPDEMPQTHPYEEDTTDFEDKERLIVALENSLSTLKSEQKQCIEMFYLQDKSYKQIVVETGYALNDVKTHIQNGKLNLKKSLLKTGK
jgi:RNA polymerase sigma factor (sigma-70 family)